ncbi:MAG: DrmB family protein [Phototrophicaceae bacterium]
MNNNKLFVGEVRPSQLMYTYGIGSIVDLPSLSVIVMGLDDWPQNTPLLSEPRLLNAVRFHLPTVEELHVLPRLETEPNSPFESAALYGVPVAVFPHWWVCPICRRLAPLNSGLFELDKKPFQPDQTVYRHTGCTVAKSKRSPEAIPSRILVACEEGHLDDFPWVDFVHRDAPCKHEKSLLKLMEYGPSGEARDLEVRCDCGVSRRLAEAFGKDNRNKMPLCSGRWPHLRKYDLENCKNHARAIVLGATNLWFPATLGVLSIPSTTDHLHQLVKDSWNVLRVVTSPEILVALRQLGQIQGELASYPDTDIIEAIGQYDPHKTQEQQIPDIKLPEWEVFSNYNPKLNSTDFRTRRLKLGKSWTETLHINNVLLVDRLREVQAVLGFARIDAVGELTDPDQQVLVRTAPLAHTPPKWVPSSELKGEGIFFHFDEYAIQSWEQKEMVRDYASQFLASHTSWREKRGIQNPSDGFLGMRYVLLHSFAHTLMRQIALEAGYSSASLKERIYARPTGYVGGPMSGILIYTSASDSEGTLGGLIGLGADEAVLYQMVRNSLESIALCAGDPLCAEHSLDQSGKTIHAAACHACLFSPETSCERGNRYLDRSVLIPTLRDETTPLAFFAL